MPEMESPVMSPRTMSDANTLRSPMLRWDSVEAPASVSRFRYYDLSWSSGTDVFAGEETGIRGL